MRSYYLYSFLIFCALFIQACVKHEVEIQQVSIDASPQFGVPIAYCSISAERAISHFDSNGLVETDTNGALSIVYQSSESVIAVGDFLTVTDQQFSQTVTPTAPEIDMISVQGSVTITGDDIFEFDMPEGDRLDSARFGSGVWTFGLQSAGNASVSGVVQLRSADNGEVLIETVIENEQPPLNVFEETSFENLLLTFVNTPGIENGIRVSYELTLSGNGNLNVQPLALTFGLNELDVAAAGGYIAPRLITIQDKGITVSMFENLPDYDIFIESPLLNFYINNGFGLGVNLDILEIRGFNIASAQLTVSNSNIFFNSFVAPALQPGFSEMTVIRLDNQSLNPTVSEFFQFKPNYIATDLTLSLNHNDEPSVFISKDSDIRVSFEADVPVFGSIANFSLVDTADVSLGDVVESANEMGFVKALDVRLIVDNGFPLDAGVQIVFCDSLYNRIDSLFSGIQYVFNSAPVNHSAASDDPDFGRATGKTRTVVDISIPRERIDPLSDAQRMIISVVGNTTTNAAQSVRFFSDDAFETQLSAKITLSYEDL